MDLLQVMQASQRNTMSQIIKELELCERVKKHGYKIFFVPKSVVYHKESMSVGKLSNLQIYYRTRNRILFQRKTQVGLKLFIGLAFVVLVAISFHLFKYLIGGNWRTALTCLKATTWNLDNKPTAYPPFPSLPIVENFKSKAA